MSVANARAGGFWGFEISEKNQPELTHLTLFFFRSFKTPSTATAKFVPAFAFLPPTADLFTSITDKKFTTLQQEK